MASIIDRKEHNVIELTIEVPAEEFKAALERSFKKNANRFSIPGFRKGKAPIGMVKRYYGEGVLYDDAIDDVINPAYMEAIREYELDPVSRPEIDVQEIGSDKGLKAVITVTNKPEVELGQYKGVEAVRTDSEVTDSQVEEELLRIQQRNSRMVPIDDRPAEDGDTVNINYEGFDDDVQFEGGTAEDHDLVIGSNSFIPGFEEQIIGHNPGDEFDVNLSFPEDYHAEDLAGKPVVFKVRVNSIKVKELPELDDEFAKDVSEFDTLEEYTADLRKGLEEAAQRQADAEFENNAVAVVTANATIDLPRIMIENELDSMISQQEREMQGMGLTLDQYLGYLGQTVVDYRQTLAADAEQRVRTSLVLEAIAQTEDFEVTEEDIDTEIKTMAERYNMEEDQVRNVFNNDFSMLNNDIRFRKALELVKNEALPVAAPEVEEADEPSEESDTTEDA
ncbi:MAG: trigger factor [Fastidiosipilaceae bacterium]|jgi:trigger factor